MRTEKAAASPQRRRFPYFWLLVLIMPLLVMAAGVWAARVNYELQLKALRVFFKTQEFTDENVSHARLIIRYIKQKELYRGIMRRDAHDGREYRYELATLPVVKKSVSPAMLSLAEKLALRIVNPIRRLYGKSPLAAISEDDSLVLLYEAYQFERTRDYQKAIELYTRITDNGAGQELLGSLMLHRAYCYAMLEEYDEARKGYRSVMEQFPGRSEASAASILLRYMDEFNREREKVLSSTDKPVDKGEKLVTLLSHKVALNVLSNVQSADQTEQARLSYYKGLCYEELGSKSEALSSYLDSVSADVKSPAARYANRRVFVMASTMGSTNQLLDLSREVGRRQKDDVLSGMDQERLQNSALQGETTVAETELIEKAASIYQGMSTNEAPPVVQVQALPRVQVNQLSETLMGSRVRVTTISNETFTGTLTTSQNEEFIKLNTIVGQVGIEKRNIRSITRIQK